MADTPHYYYYYDPGSVAAHYRGMANQILQFVAQNPTNFTYNIVTFDTFPAWQLIFTDPVSGDTTTYWLILVTQTPLGSWSLTTAMASMGMCGSVTLDASTWSPAPPTGYDPASDWQNWIATGTKDWATFLCNALNSTPVVFELPTPSGRCVYNSSTYALNTNYDAACAIETALTINFPTPNGGLTADGAFAPDPSPVPSPPQPALQPQLLQALNSLAFTALDISVNQGDAVFSVVGGARVS